MRKSRWSTAEQARPMEHFVAGTTARCAAALVGVNRVTGGLLIGAGLGLALARRS